jgi:hypothetical protein
MLLRLPTLAGLCLFAAVAASDRSRPRDPMALPRACGAPLVLPFLWERIASAQRGGRLGETIACGRLLLELWPDWLDGQVYFATLLALEPPAGAGPPPAAADRVLAALSLLERAGRNRKPGERSELCGAMASLLETSLTLHKELEAPLRVRLQREPLALADELLQQAFVLAERESARTHVDDRRAWLATKLVAATLRAGDRIRARLLLGAAQERLARASDRAHAARWSGALDLAARHLDGDPEVPFPRLQSEPLLAEIAAALQAR